MTENEFDVKPLAIICDLDGTLCVNDQDRDPFDYFSARHDGVNPAVAETLWAFVEGNPMIDILFITARDHTSYRTAEEWMRHHLPHIFHKQFHLYMRPAKDKRPDELVKKELYTENIAPYWDVLLVLEDRNRVVKMWREIGLPCFQVAEGDF